MSYLQCVYLSVYLVLSFTVISGIIIINIDVLVTTVTQDSCVNYATFHRY